MPPCRAQVQVPSPSTAVTRSAFLCKLFAYPLSLDFQAVLQVSLSPLTIAMAISNVGLAAFSAYLAMSTSTGNQVDCYWRGDGQWKHCICTTKFSVHFQNANIV